MLGRKVVPAGKAPEHGAAVQPPAGPCHCAKAQHYGDGTCPTPCMTKVTAVGVASPSPASKSRLHAAPADGADVGIYGMAGRPEGDARSMSASQRSIASQSLASAANIPGSMRFTVRGDRAAASSDSDLANRLCVVEKALSQLTALWGMAGSAAVTPSAPPQQPGCHELGRGEAAPWESEVIALRARMDEWWKAEAEKLEAMEARIERKFKAMLQEEALVRRTVESHIDDRVTEVERETEKSCRALREDVQRVLDTCSSNLSVLQGQLERLRRHSILGDPSTASGRRRHSAALAAECSGGSSPRGQVPHVLQPIEEEPKGEKLCPRPPTDSGSRSPARMRSEL